ncbi:hypothetical protein VTO42DRAFT_2104 [Malbranchea cinnamomea]
MAANEYYSSFSPYTPHGHNGHDSSQAGAGPAPGGIGSPSPYDPRPGRYSIASDNDYPAAGGRLYGSGDPYTDDIPLKPNAPPAAGRPEWMYGDTQYRPASPEPHQSVPLNGPLDQPRRKKRNRGFFKRKIPWVTYLMSTACVAVFIAEIVRNSQLTGSPIMTKPTFNPMIGPSPYVQINMGARYVPCMRNVDGIQNSNATEFYLPCPWTTSSDPQDKDNQCTLSQLCGFNGVPNPDPPGKSLDSKPEPNQWFRFIIPMFLHAGVIHIGFNLFALLTIGADMERTIGWWRFTIVYLASGIVGFVFGANFDSSGMSSGASGCLFGILAICLLDLLYTWSSRTRPVVELITMVITIIISFVLGLLPGLDNFAHIGGFLTGLVLGLSLLRSPDKLRERIGTKPPYVTMAGGLAPEGISDGRPPNFLKRPQAFFKGRKPAWWVWWLIRAGALVAIIVTFIVLLDNFYKRRSTCSWCKYLSCIPVNDWCDYGEFKTQSIEVPSSGGSS